MGPPRFVVAKCSNRMRRVDGMSGSLAASACMIVAAGTALVVYRAHDPHRRAETYYRYTNTPLYTLMQSAVLLLVAAVVLNAKHVVAVVASSWTSSYSRASEL